MSTGSRLAYVRYNMPSGGSVPDTYKISPYIPVTASVYSVSQIPVQDPSVGPIGKTWTVGDISATKSITLTRSNSFSQNLRIAFTNNDSLLRSFQGMPSTKCDGYVNDFYYTSTLSTSSITNSPNYTVYVTLAPGFWNGTPISVNPTTYAFSNPSQHTNLNLRTSNPTNTNYRGTHYQTGSDILSSAYGPTASEGYQYPGFNDFDPTVCYANIYIITSKTGTQDYSITFNVNCLPTVGNANSTLRWWGKTYNFDGTDGDTIAPLTVQSTVFTDGRARYFGNATLSSRFSLQEQSQSVITGVEETLQNNFTLSATAKVEHRATVTLRQEIDLLGTTFNFRFMEPLSLIGNNTVSSITGVKKNFSTSLILSTDANAIMTAGLIYDIASDYTWDDFSLVGYFVTGYTLRGYATDSAEYAWTDLASDPWDAWTYESWQGLETGWDQWPEDLWNSTKRISFDFDIVEATNIIRSGVSQLLSTTALSDNSAFLKTAASSMRSDFLCDGSPSGLIGGFSTITQNAVLTAFGNYIINNAQNIEGAFNASLLANYIAKFLWSVSSDFSLDVAPTFKPSGVTNAQCIAVVNALANYKINNPQNIDSAFDPIFTARIFFTTDPYQIYKVLQETRQIFVDAELRGIQIAEEIRLNSIPAEDRDHLVPQETRSMKLRIPPMTNRFTTPKVRTE